MIEETLVGFTSLLDLAGQCPAIFFCTTTCGHSGITKPAAAGLVFKLFAASGLRRGQIPVGIVLRKKHPPAQVLKEGRSLQTVHNRPLDL